MKADEVIDILGLEPHPEGGFYRETYRSPHSTAIYFLLTPGNFSALHRIRSDELWHFYSGDPLTIVEILGDGSVKRTILGNDMAKGEVPQYAVNANTWFGSYLNEGGSFGLVGCTVSPVFEFKDLELGKREALLKEFPKAAQTITKLTRE